MLPLFHYNWQIRDEWLKWCEQFDQEELLKKRVGGMQSILHTLFHIIDVEYSWIGAIIGEEEEGPQFSDYQALESVKELSFRYRKVLEPMLEQKLPKLLRGEVKPAWSIETYSNEEVMYHVLTHEIHHMGQLAVWARELNIKPISVNFIDRNLIHLRPHIRV
ncbi:DinB family protein [Hazenella sp. IB182357]|uniref:DinB family protein n=1 Tax=Polycladospora coralii TaxID=2771432 RepID=A0A926RV84_9BACL|nr:DinB family protein [Polycladospora coralii]MBD1373517.1 DinB family protein [Polycladospora coralii]MBS7531885.1 DinB family protein [Polycladospora coralii]